MVHAPRASEHRERQSRSSSARAAAATPRAAAQVEAAQRLAGNRAVDELLSGSALPLDARTRQSARELLGAELAGVRVHTDAEAERRTADAGAAAVTEGKDVYVAPGFYQPDSEEGQFAILHELSHVVQQTENRHEPLLAPPEAERAADEAAAAPTGSGVAGQVPLGTSQLLPEEEEEELRHRTVSVSKTGKTIRSHRPSEPEVQRIGQGKPAARPQPGPDVRQAMEAGTQAQERAVGIRQQLPESERHRTVSVGADVPVGPGVTRRGAPSISGSTPLPERPTPVPVEEVKAHAKRIGHEFPPGMEDYYASHAEKQHIVRRPNESQGVENPMCEDCQRFAAREAAYRQRAQTVRDPNCTRVFSPDGSVTEYYQDGSVVQRGPGSGVRRSVRAFPAEAGGTEAVPQGTPGLPPGGAKPAGPKAVSEPPPAPGGVRGTGARTAPRVPAPAGGGAPPTLSEAAGGLSRGEVKALAELGGGGSAAKFEARLARIMRLVGHAMMALDVVSTVIGAVDSVSMALRGLSGEGLILTEELAMARDLAAQSDRALEQYRAFSSELDALDEPTLWSAGLDPPTAIRYANQLRVPLPHLMMQLEAVNERIEVTAGLVQQARDRQVAAGKVVADPGMMGFLNIGGRDVEAVGVYIDLPYVLAAYRQALNNLLQLRELLAKDIETLQGWATWLSQRVLEAYFRSLAPASQPPDQGTPGASP